MVTSQARLDNRIHMTGTHLTLMELGLGEGLVGPAYRTQKHMQVLGLRAHHANQAGPLSLLALGDLGLGAGLVGKLGQLCY